MENYGVDKFEFFRGGAYELEDDIYPSFMIELFSEEAVSETLDELIGLFVHFESIEEVHSSEIILLATLIKAIKEHDINTLEGIVESGEPIRLTDYEVHLEFNEEAFSEELEKNWF